MQVNSNMHKNFFFDQNEIFDTVQLGSFAAKKSGALLDVVVQLDKIEFLIFKRTQLHWTVKFVSRKMPKNLSKNRRQQRQNFID